jgi:hypothetical protein
MVRDIILKLEELDGITTGIYKNSMGLEFLIISHHKNIISIGSINEGSPIYPLPMFPPGQKDMWEISTALPKNLILYIAIFGHHILSNGPVLDVDRPPDCLKIDLETLITIIRLLSHPEYAKYPIDNLTYAINYGQQFFGFLSNHPDFLKDHKRSTN